MSTPSPLGDANKSDEVLAAQAALHRETVDEVRQAVERDAIVVVGMSQNPVVKKARRALEQADLSFTYLEYGSYLGQWRRRLAIKIWSGWPTFPQVFVGGTLIGGHEETARALADGSLRRRLDATD
ncbi:MAG: glutaredoxin [Deltaproteobacteria bacterium]|nr:glutaredoxin [Deltaproteobacteria bacterium]